MARIDVRYWEPLPSATHIARGSFAEFLAMALFVFFGCGAAASNAHKLAGTNQWDPASVTGIALQFGLGITVLAYAIAHISGGHINCAVTWGLTLAGKCHPLVGVCYFIAQMVGSVLGAVLLRATTAATMSVNVYNQTNTTMDRSGALGSNGLQHDGVTDGHAFLAETIGTFLLMLVVLETACNPDAVTTEGRAVTAGNKQTLAPLPIGLAVFMAHIVCIPITGCSINPTRSFGPALVSNTWDKHWIWWAAPLTGASFAVVAWCVLHVAESGNATLQSAITSKPNNGGGGDEAIAGSAAASTTVNNFNISGNAVGNFTITEPKETLDDLKANQSEAV